MTRNHPGWVRIGEPRELWLQQGPDAIEFRNAYESSEPCTIPLTLHNPVKGQDISASVVVLDYAYSVAEAVFFHVTVRLSRETRDAHPDLSDWTRFCFYDYDWMTGQCRGSKLLRHYHARM